MYDIIIIGCGPDGMTAAIYALRAGKKTLILEKETIGINELYTKITHRVKNTRANSIGDIEWHYSIQ